MSVVSEQQATALAAGMLFLGLAAGSLIGYVSRGEDAAASVTKAYYRLGQIDAAMGRQHYSLTTQPTGETLWVETKEGK